MARDLDMAGKVLDVAGIFLDTGIGVIENISEGEPVHYIVADACVDMKYAAVGVAIGIAVGSLIPGASFIGAAVGWLVGNIVDEFVENVTEDWKVFDGKSMKEVSKENARRKADFFKFW